MAENGYAPNGATALAVIPQAPVAYDWDTDEKIKLIKELYASESLSNAEFGQYLEHCRATGLNPLLKQCQPIRFGGRLTFQTTIHGLVSIACGTKAYAGLSAIEYDCSPKGEALSGQHPNWARVSVFKMVQGIRCEFGPVTVYWLERNKGKSSWLTQPWHMLGKCAVAAALRYAFEECKDTYTDDELGPAAPAPAAKSQTSQASRAQEVDLIPPDGLTLPQWAAQLARADGMTQEGYKQFVRDMCEGRLPFESEAANWQRIVYGLRVRANIKASGIFENALQVEHELLQLFGHKSKYPEGLSLEEWAKADAHFAKLAEYDPAVDGPDPEGGEA